jgi:hypothetical protein
MAKALEPAPRGRRWKRPNQNGGLILQLLRSVTLALGTLHDLEGLPRLHKGERFRPREVFRTRAPLDANGVVLESEPSTCSCHDGGRVCGRPGFCWSCGGSARGAVVGRVDAAWRGGCRGGVVARCVDATNDRARED